MSGFTKTVKEVFSSNSFRKSIFFFIFSKIKDLRIVYQKDLFYYDKYVKKVDLNLSLFYILIMDEKVLVLCEK